MHPKSFLECDTGKTKREALQLHKKFCRNCTIVSYSTVKRGQRSAPYPPELVPRSPDYPEVHDRISSRTTSWFRTRPSPAAFSAASIRCRIRISSMAAAKSTSSGSRWIVSKIDSFLVIGIKCRKPRRPAIGVWCNCDSASRDLWAIPHTVGRSEQRSRDLGALLPEKQLAIC
jgi:hypothetical protein